MATAKPRAQASDRITLLLSLVPYLLQNNPVSVAEVAENFDEKPATIKKMIEDLTSMGVPDRAGDVYSNQMFDIDWDLFEHDDIISLTNTVAIDATPRFSGREAATLLAGLSLIEQAVDANTKSVISELIRKVARGSSQGTAEITISAPTPPSGLETVTRALSAGVHVEFEYRSPTSGSATRLVDPVRVENVAGTWFLRAWCHSREALRTFRVDRLENVRMLDTKIDIAIDPSTLPDTLFDVSDTDIVAVLELPTWARSALADFAPREVRSAAGKVQLEINFGSLESVFRAISLRPGLITVVSPESVRAHVAAWATSAL